MDNTITSKIDSSTLGVVKTIPTQVLPIQNYDYGFLLSQKIAIQKQKDEYDLARDKELAEVTALIAECGKLGIVEKVIIIKEPIK